MNSNLRNQFQRFLLVFILTISLMPASISQAAGPWYVAPGGDDSNTCLSPASPCATINGAIEKATPGDIIYLAAGTYTGTGDLVVLIDRSLVLSGGWDSVFLQQEGWSTINAQRERVGVSVNSGITVLLERWIIENGKGDEWNIGGLGNGGTLTLNKCKVRNNQFQGGIINGEGAYLEINESEIVSNQGWGLINYNGDVEINQSIIDGNTITGGSGAGILNAGNMVINNSTISNNTASVVGGGIHNDYSRTITLNNSTVSRNLAQGDGGGISNNGILVLNNSTIAGNASASGSGGGIYRGISGGAVTIQNSIIATNNASDGPDCSGTLVSNGYNIIGNPADCTVTPTTGDLFNVSPRLLPLTNNGGSTPTHALLAVSPAINSGNPVSCLSTDQRGVSRVGICDIGAYEYDPAFDPVSYLFLAIVFR
jgi:hypothetical protein